MCLSHSLAACGVRPYVARYTYLRTLSISRSALGRSLVYLRKSPTGSFSPSRNLTHNCWIQADFRRLTGVLTVEADLLVSCVFLHHVDYPCPVDTRELTRPAS